MKNHLAAIGAALATIAGLTTAAAPPAAAINCIQNPSTNSHNAAAFIGSGVNIRTGPDASCTSVGLGYPGQSVTARCTPGARWLEHLDLPDR
jgi:uncharacterized protein YraI